MDIWWSQTEELSKIVGSTICNVCGKDYKRASRRPQVNLTFHYLAYHPSVYFEMKRKAKKQRNSQQFSCDTESSSRNDNCLAKEKSKSAMHKAFKNYKDSAERLEQETMTKTSNYHANTAETTPATMALATRTPACNTPTVNTPAKVSPIAPITPNFDSDTEVLSSSAAKRRKTGITQFTPIEPIAPNIKTASGMVWSDGTHEKNPKVPDVIDLTLEPDEEEAVQRRCLHNSSCWRLSFLSGPVLCCDHDLCLRGINCSNEICAAMTEKITETNREKHTVYEKSTF